jgi:hypothetical protein
MRLAKLVALISEICPHRKLGRKFGGKTKPGTLVFNGRIILEWILR